MTIDVGAVQQALKEDQLDGWLFYFFHDNDPLATHILGLANGHFVSRRWFYLIPREGSPRKLVHRIEMDALDALPGEKTVYLGWRELHDKLTEVLSGCRNVAMQYSPLNAIPYVSRVDAGMVELIQKAGDLKVVSSADLVQRFEARWTKAQLKSHLAAADHLRTIVFEAFGEIARRVTAEEPCHEYEIQQLISRAFDAQGMITNSPCIVAVNANSGSPHYQPTSERSSPIKKGDFVLLDIWAKLKEPADAVYADITWTGFVGDSVPSKHEEIFQIVRGARDAALTFVGDAHRSKKTVHGWEVDDAARDFITEKGYGKHFVHRTGHSIGLEVHANGANIDNLETKDERRLIANTGFSIEPGIYLDEFGVRSEIDVFLSDDDAIVGGQPIQTTVIPITTL
jgi:Xaa-Pro aminopeptidase